MPQDFNGSHPPDDDRKTGGPKIIVFPSDEERRKRKSRDHESAVPAPSKRILMRSQERASRPGGGQTKPARQPFFNFGKVPPFTLAFSAFIIVLHILTNFTMGNTIVRAALFYTHGFSPAQFLETPFALATLASPLTYALLHGGFVHIGFNMVMLLSLGTFYERRFGTLSMAVMSLVGALAGALGYFLFNPHGDVPLIGASAITSGLFAAFLIDYMKLGLETRETRRQFFKMLAFWLVFMVISGAIGGDDVAWQAHIGGFSGGVAVMMLKSRRRPL